MLIFTAFTLFIVACVEWRTLSECSTTSDKTKNPSLNGDDSLYTLSQGNMFAHLLASRSSAQVADVRYFILSAIGDGKDANTRRRVVN